MGGPEVVPRSAASPEKIEPAGRSPDPESEPARVGLPTDRRCVLEFDRAEPGAGRPEWPTRDTHAMMRRSGREADVAIGLRHDRTAERDAVRPERDDVGGARTSDSAGAARGGLLRVIGKDDPVPRSGDLCVADDLEGFGRIRRAGADGTSGQYSQKRLGANGGGRGRDGQVPRRRPGHGADRAVGRCDLLSRRERTERCCAGSPGFEIEPAIGAGKRVRAKGYLHGKESGADCHGRHGVGPADLRAAGRAVEQGELQIVNGPLDGVPPAARRPSYPRFGLCARLEPTPTSENSAIRKTYKDGERSAMNIVCSSGVWFAPTPTWSILNCASPAAKIVRRRAPLVSCRFD